VRSSRISKDLAERPERDSSTVGRIAAEKDLRRWIERAQARGQLGCEPGLAHSGVARDRHELGNPVARGTPVNELQQREVVVATDQRSYGTWRGPVRLDRPPRTQRL